MTHEQYMKNLCVPASCDAVLDTDTYNEIDDQYALSMFLRCGERIHTKAIYAAPFLNEKSVSAADGMEKSYQEILHILSLAEREDMLPCVYRGSTAFLSDEHTPVDSPAARHLSELAAGYSAEHPLYVIAIGAITNVASALLLNPSIAEKIVVVWLGGHSLDWPDTAEFNMMQDVASARVVFASGAPLVLLPCMGVVSAFTTTGPELRFWLDGKNRLSTYLYENTVREAESYAAGRPWSRPIWDVTAVAWLLNDGERFMRERTIPCPLPEYNNQYTPDTNGRPIRYVYHICRDALMEELFGRITGQK